MKRLISYFLTAAFAALLTTSAFAENGTAVQQTTTRKDVATFLKGPAGGATTCSTVNTTVANTTVTITPDAGKYVYITGVYVDITSDATGTTGVATLSTTNLTGAPFWSLASLAVLTNANGYRQIAETYPTGLKSSQPGLAVTFVPSAQTANEIYCIRVAGYFGD